MKRSSRRQFLVDVGAGLGVAGMAQAKSVLGAAGQTASGLPKNETLAGAIDHLHTEIDFRWF